MRAKYTLEITIHHSSLENPLSIKMKDTDLLSMIEETKPTIELMCYEKGITGKVDLKILISQNGEYFVSKEFEYDIKG